MSIDEIIEHIRQQPRLVIADDFEIVVQRSRSHTRKFTNGEPTHSSQSENLWISLRILHRKRPGRAVTSASSREALAILVDSAFDSAGLSSPDPWFRFPIWKNLRIEKQEPSHAVYDSLQPSLGAGWDLFEENYEVAHVETSLRRKSERFGLSYSKDMHAVSFSLLHRGEGNLYWVKEERALNRPLRERGDWLAAAARLSSRMRKAIPLRISGRSHAILAPGVVVNLLKKLTHGFYADAAQLGKMFFPAMIGQTLFAPCISIADHGQYPEAPQSAPFDMEGSLTQETLIVDRGQWKDLLYDTYAATRENRLSTGNFLRAPLASHPRIAASNLFLKPGAATVAQLVQSMQTGVMIESLDACETVSGEEDSYLLLGRGWRVVGGRCVEPVKNVALKCGLFELFQRAVSTADDLRFYGALGSPSIFFEEIPLSS